MSTREDSSRLSSSEKKRQENRSQSSARGNLLGYGKGPGPEKGGSLLLKGGGGR